MFGTNIGPAQPDQLGCRVALAQLAGSLLLAAGVLLGPADSLPRALVVGAGAGTAASALAGFRYPGWPWFSAGLACSLAGLLRQHAQLDDWSLQLIWCCITLLAYVLIWPLAQATLSNVFGVEAQDGEPPRDAQPPLLTGVGVLMLTALASTLLLMALGSSCQWFAGPAWLLLSLWLSRVFPGLRPEWQLLGTLLGLALLMPMASLGGPGVAALVRPVWLLQDSFWLAGQAVAWTSLGSWCGLGWPRD